MSDSSESGLDVFDDLVRKPKSSVKTSPDADPAESAPSASPSAEPSSAPSAPDDTPPVLATAEEDDAASTPTSVTQPSQAGRAEKRQDEQSARPIPPPAVSASRAPRPPAPSDSGIVPAALLIESRPPRPPAKSESRPPKTPPPAPPAPKSSRAPLPSSPAVARVPPPASTPGVSVAVPIVAARTNGKGARWLLVAAGLLTVGSLATVLTFALTQKAGTLVVSASGPRGLALPQVATYVDGVKRCDKSPCRVEGLSDGVHIVEARAPGHHSIAGKAVKIEAGEEVPFDLELPAEDEPVDEKHAAERAVELEKPPAAEKNHPPAEPPPRAQLQPAPLPPTAQTNPTAASPELAQKRADLSEQAPAAPSATTSQPQATQGTLNINSIPASSVVVDGRPLGRTPRLGVSVTPGPHTVIFIHPEHGRKVSQVSVQAGQTATATARFP